MLDVEKASWVQNQLLLLFESGTLYSSMKEKEVVMKRNFRCLKIFKWFPKNIFLNFLTAYAKFLNDDIY